MNCVSAACRSPRHKAVKLDKYTEQDGQINTVNNDFINSNAKCPDILATLKINSYQNGVNILYKIDIGSKSNILPFCIYKIIFPRSTKKLMSGAESKITKLKAYNNKITRQLGTCFLTFTHKQKQKVCKYYY